MAIIIFSQYLRNIYIPVGTYKWRIFELFPVLLGIGVVWIYGAQEPSSQLRSTCKRRKLVLCRPPAAVPSQ